MASIKIMSYFRIFITILIAIIIIIFVWNIVGLPQYRWLTIKEAADLIPIIIAWFMFLLIEKIWNVD